MSRRQTPTPRCWSEPTSLFSDPGDLRFAMSKHSSKLSTVTVIDADVIMTGNVLSPRFDRGVQDFEHLDSVSSQFAPS